MKNIGMALLAIVSWVAVNLLVRGAQETWPVNLAGVLSRVITVSLLATWILTTGCGWRRLRPGAFAGPLLWMGLVSVVLNLLWYNAMHWTTATHAALLFRLDLVFVVLIGTWLGLERIRVPQVLVLVLMLFGLTIFLEVHRFDLAGHLVGDVMVVGAACGYAVNAFLVRRILTAMDALSVSLYNLAFSGIGFTALAGVRGEYMELPRIGAQAAAWLWIAALGLATAISLPLYYAALARMPVWKLRTWMLLAPLLVAVVEASVWGISLSPLQACGGVLMLGGLAILIYLEPAQPTTAQT
ncbi:MAG: DMT family transporter [Pirellulaceae bacterium]